LRLVWKRFWLLVSVGALVCGASSSGQQAGATKLVNELTLAGLRPGLSKAPSADKTYRELERDAEVSDAYVWGDICTHRELRVEADGQQVVKTVTVSVNYKLDVMAKCAAIVMDPKRLKMIATGHGLQLGDACGRIAQIYGNPKSKSPSVKGSDKLELYLYTFDWAGPDVPQVMEVSCDASSQKVVEIMLAASSL
jgi:hypothetical protein